MALLNFSPKSNNFESLVRKSLNDEGNLNKLLQILDTNPNWLEENIRGEISSGTLMEIISLSYQSEKYSLLLVNIIDFIEESNINNQIFFQMVRHPNCQMRDALQISLAHKKLNEEQLRYLCNQEIAFECYFELAILYYIEKVYTIEILKTFIEEFKRCKYSYMMDDLIEELTKYYDASTVEKYEYISKLLPKDK